MTNSGDCTSTIEKNEYIFPGEKNKRKLSICSGEIQGKDYLEPLSGSHNPFYRDMGMLLPSKEQLAGSSSSYNHL